MIEYTKCNSEIISNWTRNGWIWGQEITHEEFIKARNGEWDVVLTPTKKVPHWWFGELRGKKVLALASGGGQQVPILSALGAECTLLDYSEAQCDKDRLVAKREGYDIRVIQGDMTKPFPFEDEEFDLVFYPVSNCYIDSMENVFREVQRVLKKNGRFIAGLSLDINYVFNQEETDLKYPLPFNPLYNDEQMKDLMDTDSGIQFSHSIEECLRGLLQNGFSIEDLYQDTNGEGRLHEYGITSFISVLSIRK